MFLGIFTHAADLKAACSPGDQAAAVVEPARLPADASSPKEVGLLWLCGCAGIPWRLTSLYSLSSLHMIPLGNRDNATLEAANLAFDYAWRRVFDEQAAAQSISLADAPLFGIRWSKKIIAALDRRQNNRRGNQLLAKVRNSALPRIEYDRLGDLFKRAYFAPGDFLPEWEEWRTIADRYRLGRRRSWAILAAVVSQLISAGVNSTLELAAIEPAALEVLTAPLDGRHAIRNFRRAARMVAANASSSDALILNQKDVDAHAFQRAVKRHRAELTRDDPDSGPSSSGLRLPEGFGRLGPWLGLRPSVRRPKRHQGWVGSFATAHERTC